jgi:hypothetical protein
MNPELAYYVVRYYHNLMTDTERRANSHLIGTLKATRGRDDPAAQQEAKQKPIFGRMLSDDPTVLELSRDGLQAFRARTATRILQDHSTEVFLNHCPRCHELARTPKAQQCRFCGLDWHLANQTTCD